MNCYQVVLHADMLDYMWNSQLPSIVTSQLLDSGNTVSPPTYSRQLVPQTEPSSSDFSFVDCIFSSFSQSPSTFSHSRNTGMYTVFSLFFVVVANFMFLIGVCNRACLCKRESADNF